MVAQKAGLRALLLSAERIHDIGRSDLEVGQMITDHVVELSGGFYPDNVDDAMDAPAIKERYRDAAQSVRCVTPIGAALERRIARAITFRSCLGQNSVDTLGVLRQLIFRLV